MRVHWNKRGDGPAILFLHGVGSSSKTWSGVMELLEGRYTVASFDLLGHGESAVFEDPSHYTRDRALEDVDDILVELGAPVVLVGHSLGGYLALAHAATRPNVARAIVVLNTGPGFRDPEKREAWNERSRRNAHRFGVPIQAAELNLQEDSVVMENLAEISVPTLILAGDADRAEYSGAGQYMERKMPAGRILSVEGGEHLMHEASHAETIASILDDFVSALDA